MKDDLAELAGELPALFSKLVLHLENTGGVGLGLRRTPVVGCRLEDDERDDREVVLEPRARQPPCCDASECLFNLKPSRAAGEFLYQSGTLSRCNDRCTLSSCSLGTRSPTFCSSFSGG